MLVSIGTFMCFYLSVPSSLSLCVPCELFGARENRDKAGCIEKGVSITAIKMPTIVSIVFKFQSIKYQV